MDCITLTLTHHQYTLNTLSLHTLYCGTVCVWQSVWLTAVLAGSYCHLPACCSALSLPKVGKLHGLHFRYWQQNWSDTGTSTGQILPVEHKIIINY